MRIGMFQLCLASAVLLAGCVKSTKTTYSDQNVTVVFKDTANLLNVHASHGYFELTVFGQQYDEVRGYIPFYIPIPEKKSILFVTGRDYDNGQATVHVINLETKQHIKIPAYDSHIGSNIRTNNTDSSEIVEKIDGDKIVIRAEGFDRSFRYYIDLAAKTFEKEEAEYRNSPIGTTNRYTYINGKSPSK